MYNMDKNEPIKIGELRHWPEVKEMCIVEKTIMAVIIHMSMCIYLVMG